ncbi:MAG TPA: NAD(P)/FAD-dependent oxidoreductase [Acidimicrobiia bacterium]
MSSPDTAQDGPEVVIVGAGPAGLTAAYQLTKRGVGSTVLEADDVVGGISRTAQRDGWRFDIGGHRFFTKVKPVEDLWFEILGPDDFLRRPRKSRVYYKGKFYDYPLVPLDALRKLGFIEAMRCGFSYVWVRIHPPKDQTNFEGFMAGRFGWRLYRTFFKAYTEKLWGVPADAIQADWGAQRIKDLSLFRAVWEALKPKRVRRGAAKSKQLTSLIEEFNYPKYGPGMMWERAAELVTARGTKVVFNSTVTAVHLAGGRAVAVTATADGVPTRYDCTHVVSSMPLTALIKAMDPPPPPDVLAAANGLTYRDFITVALVVPADAVAWDDNWIYVHEPEVKTMRIQNFGSWSPYLVKDGCNVLGLEYTLLDTEPDWTAPDEELIERGKQELEYLRLVRAADVEAGYVVRMPKAYPMYDATYKANVETLRVWLEANAPNVYPVGRNGMHKYNNQDHSMYTAMQSVENIFGAHHDVWSVNVEADYHEERQDDTAG